MQLQVVSHSYGVKPQERSIEGPDFALILAALMEGTKGGGGVPASRPAAPAAKIAKGVNSPREVKPGAGAVRKDGSGQGPHLEAMVDRVAAKYGLDPALLRAVVEVESDFNPLAVSGAGAMGLMQLMPDTARSLGVKNPFDPMENLEGGARYLKSMIGRFNGNLRLALAAYNAGPGAVEKYGGVPPYGETLSYLRKINRLTGGLIG
ncbi:MAG: lytic transglycosylase domain-containing protein [Peptococcaceae bacterium]|nr:lytic transglycosylase domain-containing protein [Peptococcaceae bacterium]